MLRKSLRQRQGNALVFVIMIFSIVMILAISVLTISDFSIKSSVISKKQIQAHYLARAGAEATKRAWEDAGIPKPEGKIERLYVDENYEFKLDKPKRIKGFVDVEVTKHQDTGLGSWRIESIAEVDGVKGEAILTSMGNTSIEELNEDYKGTRNRIIDYDTGEILIGEKHQFSAAEKGDFKYGYISKHKEIRGTLEVTLKEETKKIKLKQDGSGDDTNALRHVALVSHSLIFNNPINLNLQGQWKYIFWVIRVRYEEKQGALIASAETIVFNNDILLKYKREPGTFKSDYGILILNLPAGLGYTKEQIKNKVLDYDEIKNDNDDERYGVVYFAGNINSVGLDDETSTDIRELSGKAFYFKKSDSSIIIGGPKEDGWLGEGINQSNKLIEIKEEYFGEYEDIDMTRHFYWN